MSTETDPAVELADTAISVAAHLESELEQALAEHCLTPRLGIAVATAAVAKRMRRAVGLGDEAGVLVGRVGRESAAATAGLSRGDLVTEADGAPVLSIGDLHRAVRAADGEVSLK